MLVNIKAGGTVKCGASAPTLYTDINMSPAACTGSKSWTGPAARTYLGADCILPAGSYELCVQFFSSVNGREIKLITESCKSFTILNAEQTPCSPPQNINPATLKEFSVKEVSGIINFNWSPLVISNRQQVTYHLVVWEVEEGQTNAQAMYGNLPVLEKDIKGVTKFTALPGSFEKREATYVWRVVANDENGRPVCTNAKSDATNFKVNLPQTFLNDSLNTPCGNGDFESGILDGAEWKAGFTKLSGNNSTFSPPFNNTMLPANGNPADAPLGAGCATNNQALQNHHVIVTPGTDPTVPALNRVPPSVISNKYALRLGNNCPGCGTERIQKRFVVTPADSIYRFMYALVFQAPHSATDNPSLWVRVYNAANTAVPGLVYLDPLNPAPMDRAISDPLNPYWKSYNSILWRDWACAKINLSSLIGQVVTIEILTNDCAQCGHYGYGYFDNFCTGCSNNPPADYCCQEKITVKNETVTAAGSILKINQPFNIVPVNVKKITAEIIAVEDNAADTSCMQCTAHDKWDYQFISHNTASWNSAMAMNATPVNSTAYYPSKMIEWHCNKQGDLDLNFKISLPANKPGCTRKGKICIRYRFEDIDCKTCDTVICYNFNYN